MGVINEILPDGTRLHRMKPDNKMLRSSNGGHLVDIPKPWVRWFADKRRRREVSVIISVYTGIGVHYHVTLMEEDDYIWDSSVDPYQPAGIWRHPWDSEKLKGLDGRRFSAKFNTSLEAQEWARSKFKRHFRRHKLVNAWGTRNTPRWFYREGD